MTPIIERFPMSPRGYIQCDPVHAQVVFDYQGRKLLGDVREVYFDGTTGVQRLRVHHFNGDRWPVDPPVRSVEVLSREFERIADEPRPIIGPVNGSNLARGAQ